MAKGKLPKIIPSKLDICFHSPFIYLDRDNVKCEKCGFTRETSPKEKMLWNMSQYMRGC